MALPYGRDAALTLLMVNAPKTSSGTHVDTSHVPCVQFRTPPSPLPLLTRPPLKIDGEW